jgi:hypothetical protein
VIKRFFDLLCAVSASVFLALPIIIVALAVKLTSPGPVLYWSDRVGRHNRIFRMPKFRSMRADTPSVATHLLTNPEAYLTPIGPFLRKTSLDELPQLWSILKGDMSFVGPRPALFNQDDLAPLQRITMATLAMPRLAKRLLALTVDASLCVLTVWLALYLRLGEFVVLSGPYLWAVAGLCCLPCRSLWFMASTVPSFVTRVSPQRQ